MPDSWVPDLTRSRGAKYVAIAEAIASAVETGELRSGDRLPPQRDLAARLGIDLTTVTKAYEQARARGLIGARGRAGSFVLPQDAIAAGPPPRDTGMNMPPEVEGGTLLATWERTASALLRAPGAGGRLHYTPAGGREADRAAGAAIFGRMGLASDAAQVVVTAGAQNALHAIVGATMEHGDVVACGAHIYPGFRAIAKKARLQLAPMPRVEAGALEELCGRQRVAALYVVPTNDNPTAGTLDEEERAALAGVARRYGVRIIEDDAYGQLPEKPLAPLSSFVPELGWYIASMSKTISPALRVAHVRAPSFPEAMALATEAHHSDSMPPPLNVALVTRWLEDGSYDRLIAETRAEAVVRLKMAEDVLPAESYAADPCGYHLWVPLKANVDAGQAAAALRAAGLTAIPGGHFAVEETSAPALRVSLGGAIGRAVLTAGLRALKAMLAE
ncbi:PLP-dependent aminotransferase family protein [Sphingopyxis sp. BSN-002]|uniref:aminotransferase-like domain-containing protein n=1 Tax=Sphingopyxis sp. BSN-002 TaxID=2911495 RepID=UPI001EDBEAD1|nr:PLP-dependent aminotransferase family protein [Sphingopyxis sp. BSN-002]UKK86002.1 PLP-dependent aminotransferase family protein [Sphingopyxis sp. BSN-002]